MTHVMNKVQFAGKIKSIGSTKAKFSADVQAALVAATYLCIKHSNGTTPFQQILDAVGTTAHRQGIIAWCETYAPVMLRDGKLVGNKTAYTGLDVKAITDTDAAFDAYVDDTGMDLTKWDTIAKDKNTSTSIFNLDTTLDAFCKKLEKNGLSELAARVRKTETDYMKDALQAELTKA